MVMVYEDRAGMLYDSIVSLRVQVLRGTWQGLLGICVFEPEATSRSEAASPILGEMTTGNCVPVVGGNGKQVN